MSSVYGQIMSALPFLCARVGMTLVGNIVERGRRGGDERAERIDTSQFALFRQFVEALDNDSSFTSPAPPIPSADAEPHLTRRWRFQHNAATPAVVEHVQCRVRGASFRAFEVLNSLKWGTEAGGSFRHAVRITTAEGRVHDLPLDNEHLFCRFHVKDGACIAGQSPLFPLRTYLDRGLVMAFAYELPTDPSGRVQPFTGDQEADDAADELSRGRTSDPDTWWSRFTEGTFMTPPDDLADFARAVVGIAPERRISVERPRVLVCLSLALCRELNDFEPGGVIGAARLYPHMMVKTSAPLRLIEGSVRYDRPEETQPIEMTDADAAIRGCHGCDEANSTISAIFVADQNDSEPLASDAPAWPALFAYARDHAEDHEINRRLHMVRRTSRHATTIESCGVRTSALLRRQFTNIRKVAYQGEFDNVHLAPSLALAATTYRVQIPYPESSGSHTEDYPVDASTWRLNDITMAPYCEHDCFHTHWRWGPAGAPPSTCGWGSGETPHTVAGSPMVRRNQDVWVTLRAANALTYEVEVHPNVRTGEGVDRHWTISTHDWHVIMYHGSAYAQAVLRRFGMAALMNFGAEEALSFYEPGVFVNAAGEVLTPHNSRAVFYWTMRYGVQVGHGAARPVERIQFTDTELRTAREHPTEHSDD